MDCYFLLIFSKALYFQIVQRTMSPNQYQYNKCNLLLKLQGFNSSQLYYQLSSQQNLMINPIYYRNTDPAYRQLPSSMLIPQKAPEIQALDLGGNKKSSMNSGSKQGVKPKPSTDRTPSMNETFKDFMEEIEEGSQVKEMNNSQKTDLLQKRKQYAQSIRLKNRCSMKQQKSNKKSHDHNQTFNHSLTFTPPKVSFMGNSDSHYRVTNSNQKLDHMSQIEKQYYSMKRFSNFDHSSSKVFTQSNMNLCNSVILGDSCQAGHLSKQGNCFKPIKFTHNTTMDLGLSHRDGNHSERNNASNKQNKPHIPGHPTSARKTTQQKHTSYAEIFDKKSSMNTLIHSQKSKGSRQMGAVRKEKNALRAMATPEQQIEFREQFSVQMGMFVNGFVLEEFNEDFEGISRVNGCKNETKVVQAPNDNIETPSSQTPNTITINQPSFSTKLALSLSPQTINQCINFTQDYARIRKQQQKQLIILAKQNATFKRELASFRKEKSTLRKELEKAKGYIDELQEKARGLVEQRQQNQMIVVSEGKVVEKLENVQGNMSQSNPSKIIPPTTISHSLSQDPTLQQILISTQQQLFSLRSNNKALQLKVYMLEKKLAHEEEVSKKKLALEVHNWRDKYNKLRNENISLKDQLHPFNNRELSFSMDISREE